MFEQMDRDEVLMEILISKKCKEAHMKVQEFAYAMASELRVLTKSIKLDPDDPISLHIEEITISDISRFEKLRFEDIKFYVFTVTDSGAEIETLEDDGSSEEIAASHHWILPNREFHGQWEHLIYEKGLKENILRFAQSIMLFAQKKIDANVISCNKLVLLHGPPGTGKTSLCKALAQKLSIHLRHKFSYTHLFEINSHSLFSKWFSESGKLVLKLFASIKSVADHPQSLVIVLIDEIESIAYARESVSSNEPSDSLRVVNAVLTQLDQLRKYSNVLVLTTSNLTSTIDLAFIDRADLKQFVGEPNAEAIREIYDGAINELIKADIIEEKADTDANVTHSTMERVACLSQGLSGRTLRKLPLLAHAWFIQKDRVTLTEYWTALENAVKKNCNDALHMQRNPSREKTVMIERND